MFCFASTHPQQHLFYMIPSQYMMELWTIRFGEEDEKEMEEERGVGGEEEQQEEEEWQESMDEWTGFSLILTC